MIERTHIGFFGRRNTGKSSLVNAVTGQNLSVVSNIPGTTTDPVRKSMELVPLGPVMIIDTPGFDDEGTLGELRVKKTQEILREVNIAVLVIDAAVGMTDIDEELQRLFEQQGTPYLVVANKCDLPHATSQNHQASALTGHGVDALKELLAQLTSQKKELRLLADLFAPGDFAVLVTPIDAAAPKDRMILPQSHAIRDILDANAICVATQPGELRKTIAVLQGPPALVITDSQVFAQVAEILPPELPLTSFSILFARYKGFLQAAVAGVEALAQLPEGARILIAEGCTHHRQCDDIGTVKLPRMIQAKLSRSFAFSFCTGHEFPEDLSPYALVVHCGGCMLNARAVQSRRDLAQAQAVPFSNYGVTLAWLQGILERCLLDGKLCAPS